MDASEYSKLAAVEDRMWYFRALHAEIARRLVAAFDRRAATILDAGCGTGGLIRRLAPAHPLWTWTGLDISDLALAHAHRRVPAATTLVEASVTQLPFDADAFDAVISADVLYHIEDEVVALREAYRVLKPGGILIINVPAYRWLWSYHDAAVHSQRRYTRTDLTAKLRIAGFHDLAVTYRNALTLPLVVLRRKLLPPPRGKSDVQLLPAPIEAGLNGVMSVERAWLRTVGYLPFGSSVFGVVRK